MKDLAVFDLDGTLLTLDSFALLVRRRWRDPALLWISARRKLGLLDRAGFAERAHRICARELTNGAAMRAWLDTLQGFIDPAVAGKLAELRDGGAHLVLLSSSPDEYVAPFARMAGFDEGIGSHWNDGAYRHLRGAVKLLLIAERYPQDRWRWAFAAGDDPSDRPLLQRFEESVLLRR